MTHENFMRAGLTEAQKGDLPYSAILVKDNQIIVRGFNTAQTDNDVSAHAEINVLRSFTKQKKNYSLDVFKEYTLYTTCEPCPMCAAACVWAGVSEIVFGASIEQLIAIGSEQIDLSCEALVAKEFQDIKITKGILAQECLELFKK
ncbi:nucleoside deaminase [Pleurocapsales cyanobacterium LEGE 06147]|nr:nucleoside deaminase [Pleurocapsales cyanobacterium LEGE 06147]